MSITINEATIEKLKPCKDRFDNFVKHYAKRSFTPRQFMGLKNITHQDKLWVAFRMLPESSARAAACDIAESVLHIYESKYPNDKRVRECIAATRAFTKGEISVERLREKRADAAAAYAADAAAYAADAAADAAAAYAADAAAAAADAAAADADAAYAADAAAAYAADAAAAAADAAAAAAYAAYAARASQEKRCRSILLKYWK